MGNPIFARVYERLSHVMEEQGNAEHRRELLGGLSGRVIEIGCGNGLNFRHYPQEVDEVVAVEPEPRLRASALTEARRASIPITVLDGVASSLPFEDGSFDAAVFSLVLCSVPDQEDSLREAWRVLRSGGEVRFYEHVQAEDVRGARIQRVFDLVWPFFAGGCHTSRDTVASIRRAGFEVGDVRRFTFPETRITLPTSPHVMGTARRPA